VDTREKSVRDREREAKRYREAAELALNQLQWAINYLYRIGKSAIAERLERNREHILGELRPER
jgi:AAA+ ATPase superfamily predicted ATPase